MKFTGRIGGRIKLKPLSRQDIWTSFEYSGEVVTFIEHKVNVEAVGEALQWCNDKITRWCKSGNARRIPKEIALQIIRQAFGGVEDAK